MRVCDTGNPPAVTTIMIEIVIQTVNDHAPTIVAPCLTSRPRSRSRRETQIFKTVKVPGSFPIIKYRNNSFIG